MDNDLKTDDAALNLEYPWYGPAELPFFWHARLSTQVYTAILAVTVALLLWLLIPGFLLGWVPLLNETAAKVLVVAVGTLAVAIPVSALVAPKITKERPISYWFQVLQDELEAPRKARLTERTPQGFLVLPEVAWNPRVNGQTKAMTTNIIGLDYQEGQ